MPSPASADHPIPDLRALRSILSKGWGNGGARTAVVLAHAGVTERLEAWLGELAEDRVVVLAPDPAALPAYAVPVRAARTLAEVVTEVRRTGAVDIVADLLTPDH